MFRSKRRQRSRRPESKLYNISVFIFTFSAVVYLHQHVSKFLSTPLTARSALSSTKFIPQQSTATDTHGHKKHLSASANNEVVTNPGTTTQATTQASTMATSLVIPRGPYPLPRLSRGSKATMHAGAAWAAAVKWGITDDMPLHWIAEQTHSAPASASKPEETSIFKARRKGAWIGCPRPTHLVCKGVYRAIKRSDAVNVLDVDCAADREWLPDVIRKLRSEFRIVKLSCLGPRVEGFNEDARFIDVEPFHGNLPNGSDVVVAYKVLERGTLISAMKLFKNVKRSGAQFIVTENYPGEENVVKEEGGKKKLRINTGLPPFWFPAPFYTYENSEENTESTKMQITMTRVNVLFQEKFTPDMKELVDPRKRKVRE